MSKPTPGNERIIINVPEHQDEKENEQQVGQTVGESVKGGLNILEKVGIKESIEDKVRKIDHDSPEKISKETELITERMNKLDVLITIGLYYTSLIMNWLTLLGQSTSVGNFFFELFLGSFNLTKWDFGDLSLVARISGLTTSIQIVIFAFSGIINVGARILNKPVPEIVKGPMYYGGPFQIIYVIMPRAKDYTDSITSLDAQISQWMGFISQVIIIMAAIFAGDNRVKALDPFTQGNESFIGSGYMPKPNSEDQFGEVISPANATQVTLAIQNAALFARATYIVSVVAIIMTSSLNIIQWLADVWRINQDDLLIYTMYKLLTRALLCQPCCGDRFLSGASGGIEGKGIERRKGKRGRGGSRGVSPRGTKLSPSSSSSSPLKESPSSEKFDEKSSEAIQTEQENQSLLLPGQSSSKKKLGRVPSVRKKR